LREIVGLRLELGDERGALESVATLVALEPRVAKHRTELARLAKRTGREDRHAEVLASVAEMVGDAKLHRDLLLEAMKLYRDVLGDRTRAAHVGLAAFALARDDRTTELAIARDLDPLLASEQRWAERCDVLDRIAALETDAQARRAALGELARAASSALGDPERAIAAWSARLADDADDRDALDGLAIALEDRGRWRELLPVLERRAQLGDGSAA